MTTILISAHFCPPNYIIVGKGRLLHCMVVQSPTQHVSMVEFIQVNMVRHSLALPIHCVGIKVFRENTSVWFQMQLEFPV